MQTEDTRIMGGSRLGQNMQRRYEIAEDVLRSNIEEGILRPGVVLLEGPLAEILQISRAPVQRALRQLEQDGIVHRFKGRGYLVGPSGHRVEPDRADIKTLGLIIPDHVDEALQSRSSWERIYNEIENDVAGCIVFGQYRIIENELARHFSVSRTVVRDVLARLSERGLVRKNQSSHWVAGPLTAQTVKEHFGVRRTLEPQALATACAHIERKDLEELLAQLQELERGVQLSADGMESIQAKFIETCILATPNERLADLVRTNLLPVTAIGRLLRHLGLPEDPALVIELRLVVELLARGASNAARAMLESHLDGLMNRTIAQMKIVAILPGPKVTAGYLTQITE